MDPFLTSLRAGGPAFTVSDAPEGFAITVVAGRESGFNDIVRLCVDKAGSTLRRFPDPTGAAGTTRS
ncbi:MAG: hypothetical protein EON86_01115 [Brevundimonas sp.]|nr:MAG: hypothetical protein EON86_01115 [Brevundimonas sp.]